MFLYPHMEEIRERGRASSLPPIRTQWSPHGGCALMTHLPSPSHLTGWVRVSIYEFFLEGRGRQKHSVHSNWEWKSRLEVICFKSSKVCLIVFWKVMLRLRSPVLILPLYPFIVNYFFSLGTYEIFSLSLLFWHFIIMCFCFHLFFWEWLWLF